MINELKLFNLPPEHKMVSENNGHIFVLKTCQRTIALGFNLLPYKNLGNIPKSTTILMGPEAYTYLLETICGLQSKVLGENEIVDQFKVAFSHFMTLPQKNTYLQKIIEKLFKDAKNIRTSYLLGLGQLSYAGITRKLITSTIPNGKILIIGSGQLAKDCAKLLDRKYDIYLSSRNSDKVEAIKNDLNHIKINSLPFKDYNRYKEFKIIINTVGCNNLVLFNQSFFNSWNHASPKLFIDLGSPSVIETTHGKINDVYRLSDIFALSESFNTHKLKKVSEAKVAMKQIVQKRSATYSLHFPYAWEDMQFA